MANHDSIRFELSFEAEPSTPRPTVTPAVSKSLVRQIPEDSIMFDVGQWANSHSVFREPCDLRVVEVNAVRQPDTLVEPAYLFQVIERPAAVVMKTVIVLIAGFSQVGMEKTIVLLCESGAIDHQLAGHIEGRTRRQRDAQERTVARIVIFRKNPLAIRDNCIVALHQPFVRNTSVCEAEIDGAARQRHAHSQF